MRRIGSMAYEALLLIAILFIATWIFLFFAQGIGQPLARPLLQIWLFLLTGTYFAYCWVRGGQTLPMKTWRIRLVRIGGKRITLSLAIARYVLAVFSVAAGGLGFAWALVDHDRQFLHDRVIGTRLIAYKN